VIDLALHIYAGKFRSGRRVEGGPVVYCAREGGVAFQSRAAAWRDEYGIKVAYVPFATICISMNLLHPEADTSRLC
jgi:hypothetical protein